MNCKQFKTFYSLSLLAVVALVVFCPDLALASDGISEFTGPVDKVVNTITGPVGKAVAIIGMAICGFVFITQK